jgi:NTE family protein
MTYHITQMTLENYSPDILINVSRHCCGTFDFYRAEEIVELGRQAAQKSLVAQHSPKSKSLPSPEGPAQL